MCFHVLNFCLKIPKMLPCALCVLLRCDSSPLSWWFRLCTEIYLSYICHSYAIFQLLTSPVIFYVYFFVLVCRRNPNNGLASRLYSWECCHCDCSFHIDLHSAASVESLNLHYHLPDFEVGSPAWVYPPCQPPATLMSLSLQWRHKGHDGISNHQPHHCLLNRLFRCRSKKTSKLRVTGNRWIPRTNGQ